MRTWGGSSRELRRAPIAATSCAAAASRVRSSRPRRRSRSPAARRRSRARVHARIPRRGARGPVGYGPPLAQLKLSTAAPEREPDHRPQPHAHRGDDSRGGGAAVGSAASPAAAPDPGARGARRDAGRGARSVRPPGRAEHGSARAVRSLARARARRRSRPAAADDGADADPVRRARPAHAAGEARAGSPPRCTAASSSSRAPGTSPSCTVDGCTRPAVKAFLVHRPLPTLPRCPSESRPRLIAAATAAGPRARARGPRPRTIVSVACGISRASRRRSRRTSRRARRRAPRPASQARRGAPTAAP